MDNLSLCSATSHDLISISLTVHLLCRAMKLEFHGAVSSQHPRDILARMSLTGVSDEDATRMLATCPQQAVRVAPVEFGERHDARTNGQHYTPQQTAGRPIRSWQAEQGSRHPREDVGRVGEDVTRMLRGNCSYGIPALRS